MRIIHYSIFRALCAIAVGALLVQYREEMVTWMTMVIGGLFFLSGIVAIVMSYARKKAMAAMLKNIEEANAEGEESQATQHPTAQLSYGAITAGIGSMLLGTILCIMPETFVKFLTYILAGFLVLGAIQQFFTLGTARSYGKVGFGWWIMPLLLFGAGCMALLRPETIASFPLFFIGWCIIIYGIVEFINAFKARSCRQQAQKQAEARTIDGKPDFSDAEVVEFEEI